MSLQHTANNLAAHGRGPDTILVHMTPGELKSLNDLAMAHGGHITINPHTGLPEAGFLSSILPMVAGFALGPAGFGLSQMEAGLLSGGLSMALNPGQGLMGGITAGLGAYGGAGLGDALAKSGMEQATQAELAKNEAFAQAQKAATPQALGFGDVATKGLPANLSQADYVKSVLDASKPAADIANAANTNTLVNSGFGGPDYTTSTMGNRLNTAFEGVKGLGTEVGRSSFMNNIGGGMGLAKTGLAAASPLIADSLKPKQPPPLKTDSGPGQQYDYNANPTTPTPMFDKYGREQTYFNSQYTPRYADGGTTEPGTPTQYSYDPMAQSYLKIETPKDKADEAAKEIQQQVGGGGQKGVMSDAAFAAQQNQGQKNMESLSTFGESLGEGIKGLLSQPPMMVQVMQAIANAVSNGMSTSSGGVSPSSGSPMGGIASTGTHGQANAAVAAANSAAAAGGRGGAGNTGTGNGGTASGVGTGIGSVGGMGGGLREGGLSDAHFNLGGYSDGGRLLRGPGDGVSDSIPATIGHKQPARLADGEFVVPARIVSELGNGSTEAGARKLYAMMDRVQSARSKTVGKGKIAANSRSEKYLPA